MESFAIQRIAWLHWNPDQSALKYYLIVSFRVCIGPTKFAARTESENSVKKGRILNDVFWGGVGFVCFFLLLFFAFFFVVVVVVVVVVFDVVFKTHVDPYNGVAMH